MRQFILANTRLQSPPDLPELRLHLADEILPIWRLLESASGEQPPPFWAFAWVGGMAVARYLLDRPDEVRGRRVLDLGAGSGLCSVAAGLAGAAEVVGADIDPLAGAAFALNVEANALVAGFQVDDVLAAAPPGVDVILAGDVCYEKEMADRVVGWLSRAALAGTRVLVGDPGRLYFPRADFELVAEYELRTARELEERDVRRAGVHVLLGCR